MELKDNLISIVVPVYQSEKYIESAIQSVLAQTYRNWEMILVDDGSSDRSYEIIKKYESSQISVYRLESNQGQAAARNVGRGYARGRYLAYLDADDLWSPEKLERQYHFMTEHQYAFTFTGYEFAGADGIRNGTVVHVPPTINYKQALKNTTISTITVMFDRKQIKDELLAMPLGVRGEDTATWWQILRSGMTAYGLDQALSVYRRHGQSHSGNKLKAVWGTYLMYRRCENLSIAKSWYYFLWYLWNAVRRRI
jgi:teichuronic acid biosynthesis glycosyltransferase TuaG